MIEVAHDFVPKIKNWLLQHNIQNSFDTWHGKMLIFFEFNSYSHINKKVLIISDISNMLRVELKTRNGLSWNFKGLRMKSVSLFIQSIINLYQFQIWNFLLLSRNKGSGKGHERNQQWCPEMGGWKVVFRAIRQAYVPQSLFLQGS